MSELILSKNLNVDDLTSIMNYGSEVQSSLHKGSESLISNIRNNQVDKVGKYISDILTEINYLDIDSIDNTKGIRKFVSKIPFIGNITKSVSKVIDRYDKVSTSIDRITTEVSKGAVNALKDNERLKIIYLNNSTNLDLLDRYIDEGEIKLSEVTAQLDSMTEIGKVHDELEVSKLNTFITNLDKKISDLKVTKSIIIQSQMQIQIIQNNNVLLAEKAKSIVNQTIPLWKLQVSLALAMFSQENTIAIQSKVSETTNRILTENSNRLNKTSIEVAKSANESVVSLDTLRDTTRNLIATIKEVESIRLTAANNKEAINQLLIELENECTR